MKNILLSTILILFAFSSLSAQVNLNKGKKGKTKTETRSVSDYDRIHVTGSFEVVLVEGKEGDIKISGESDVIANINVAVKDGTLKLSTKSEKGKSKSSCSYGGDDVVITVPVKDIKGITLTGSGEINSEKVIKSDELEVYLTGSGDIELEVKATRLLSKVTGSGDIELEGSTNYLRVDVKGSGDFSGVDLDANITEVVVTGSGDAEVVANEFINAHVTGSGDIVYSGNPEREQIKASGSGDISKE